MITTPMVLIIGAGASVDYGFPLGSGLVTEIVSGLAPGNKNTLRVSLRRAGFEEGDLNEFRRRLIGSDPLSIDAFLEGAEPEVVAIGRAAIATIVLGREHLCKERGVLISRRLEEDHWLRYVWNEMRERSTPETFTKNQISFVTFNYDRTIEYYFENVLQDAFDLPHQAASELVHSLHIVHLHGHPSTEFGDYFDPQPGALVLRAAEGIRVIHDRVAADDPNFALAHEWMKQASQVCFVGFGYHPVNIERLQVAQHLPSGRPIMGSTYEMGEAQVDTAKLRIGGHTAMAGWWRNLKAERFLREAVRFM